MASKEIGIEVNADKTEYMVMSRDQNAAQSHSMKIDNSPLKEWKSSNIWEQFYTGRNLEQIEVGECLLSFGAESCVFQFAIQKFKD